MIYIYIAIIIIIFIFVLTNCMDKLIWLIKKRTIISLEMANVVQTLTWRTLSSTKEGRSLLADCCGICPFWPLISGPLVPCCSLSSSLPLFLPSALPSLTLTISSSIDLPGPLGESFFYFNSSPAPLVKSCSRSHRGRIDYDRIKWRHYQNNTHIYFLHSLFREYNYLRNILFKNGN